MLLKQKTTLSVFDILLFLVSFFYTSLYYPFSEAFLVLLPFFSFLLFFCSFFLYSIPPPISPISPLTILSTDSHSLPPA